MFVLQASAPTSVPASASERGTSERRQDKVCATDKSIKITESKWLDESSSKRKKNDDDNEELKFTGATVSGEFCTTKERPFELASTLFRHTNQGSHRRTSISQFSALTLRRAFNFSRRANGLRRHHNHNHQEQQQQPTKRDERKDSQGNLSSLAPVDGAPVEQRASSSSASSSHRRSDCRCCCCTNQCSASEKQRPTNQPTPGQINAQPPSTARRRWQKRPPRKPIPVPPPIVPLYRQLACGLADPGQAHVYAENSNLSSSSSSQETPTLTFKLHSDKRRSSRNVDHNSSRGYHLIWPIAPSCVDSKVSLDIGQGRANTTLRRQSDSESQRHEMGPGHGRALPNPSSDRHRHRSCSRSRSGLRLSRGDDLGGDDDASRLHEANPSGQNNPAAPDELSPLSVEPRDCAAKVALNDNRFVGAAAEIKNTLASICLGHGHQRHREQMGRKRKDSRQMIGRSGVQLREASCDKTPIVDVKSRIRDTSQLPQAERVTHAVVPILSGEPPIATNEHQPGSSLSAIYDLPESVGAREFVRVEVSDGRRTITASRLPLRPARRPAMAPPPPPPRQQQHQRKSACAVGSDGPLARIAADSGCVVSNFSAPSSTVKVVSSTIQTRNFTQESGRIEQQQKSNIPTDLVSCPLEESIALTSNKERAANPLQRLSEVLHLFQLKKTTTESASWAPLVASGDISTPSRKNKTASELKQNRHQADGGTTFSCQEVLGAKEVFAGCTGNQRMRNLTQTSSGSKREISSEKVSNMGSGHSSSAASAAEATASETKQRQTETCIIKEPDKKRREPLTWAATRSKARSQEERSGNGDSTKRNSCDAGTESGNSKQQTAAAAANKTATTNEPTTAPQIIKSLSNMTNKIVGEAKIITGAPRDEGPDCAGKQHVQSALQMCIKGVVKPTHKGSQQTPSAGNKRASNHRQQQQQQGHLLERPNRGFEDSLERRRKSLQDGDVFIYPRLYKDLNECRKCFRDNRICNCIEMELSSDGSGSSMEQDGSTSADSKGAATSNKRLPQANNLNFSHRQPAPNNNNNNNNSNNNNEAPQCIDQSAVDRRRWRTGDHDDDCAEKNWPPGRRRLNTAALIERAPKQVMPASSTGVNCGGTTDNLATKDDNNNNVIAEATPNCRQSSHQSELKLRSAQTGEICSNGDRNDTESLAAATTTESAQRRQRQRQMSKGPADSCWCADANCCRDRRHSNCTESSLSPIRDNSPPTAATRQGASSSSSSLLSPDVERRGATKQETQTSKKVTKISIGSPTRCCLRWQASSGGSELNEQRSEQAINDERAAATRNEHTHTSIISIQTRRRNMATKVGARRAIYHQDGRQDRELPELLGGGSGLPIDKPANEPITRDRDRDKDWGQETRSLVPLNTHGIVLASSEPITICESLSPICSKDSGLGTGPLDYSPILSSVRDYINNMNHTELQVQTSMAPSSSARRAETRTISVSSASAAAADSGLAVVATSAGCTTLALSESPANSVQVVTSTATGSILQTTTFTTAPLPVASIKAHAKTNASCTDPKEASPAEMSPKKSIFDGASKDEILEYLEDARERVPEILMAADDVMVISENELIVVNQLEPDSPATPILIVETGELIGGGGGGDGGGHGDGVTDEEMITNANCSSSNMSAHSSLADPDQMRQHLEQMYQTAAAAAAKEPLETTESPDSIYEETKASLTIDRPLAVDLCSCPDLNKYSTGSPEFRLLAADAANSDQRQQDMTPLLQEEQSSPAGTRCETIATAIVSQCGLLNFDGSIYAGRRNSVSENSGQPMNGRENAMQILALQKRYKTNNNNNNRNRNSLSSPSSSPPSSTSPSSSSSPNQTSGNCSAATSFYASSSLSCSSPLLHLNGTFTSSSSPAFNQTAATPQPPAPPLVSELGCTNKSHSRFDGFDDWRLPISQDTTSNRATPDSTSRELLLMSPDAIGRPTAGESAPFPCLSRSHHVDRDDSGIGSEPVSRLRSMTICGERNIAAINSDEARGGGKSQPLMGKQLSQPARSNSETSHLNATNNRYEGTILAAKLSRIDETGSPGSMKTPGAIGCEPSMISSIKYPANTKTTNVAIGARFPSQPANKNQGLGGSSRGVYGHYNALSRLNNYFMNRHPLSSSGGLEFQCLDCDQFIDVDQATIMNKTNELRLLRATDSQGRLSLDCSQATGGSGGGDDDDDDDEGREMSPQQLDRAYVAAMNGLPLCKGCEKKRIERKEIISEFVETELKYGRDLKIIHDEFYRPMQIAGLLSKDQINTVFLNLEELIMAHCRFANRLETTIREAHSIGDTDFNTVCIGGLFVESAEMLNTFESYCIRQGAAALMLARLAKERELLRIFLRVSQMENTQLRRMNLAAFLMVPVQRVTKYPLLLNRLYKVTAYHHKDREALRDAQLRVELHLEHINQQTKGIGASNKIWRRISSLSTPVSSNRRGLMNAEDIGYIKLRKTAIEMLKWDRDETQFIHSGKIHFAPLAEYLTRQKMKPLRYMPAYALLIISGRPNWKYHPELVKANLDSKSMVPTPGGNGIKEAALLLFREKNGRFVACREPLLLSNCVLSADCSQFNSECPPNSQPNSVRQNNQPVTTNSTATAQQQQQQQQLHRKSCSSNNSGELPPSGNSKPPSDSSGGSIDSTTSATAIRSISPKESSRAGSLALSSQSLRGRDGGETEISSGNSPPGLATAHSARSYSLASALPQVASLTTTSSACNLSKPILSAASSNLTILNQLMTKVNSYHNRQQATNGANHHHHLGKQQSIVSGSSDQSGAKNGPVSPSASLDSGGLTTQAATASDQQEGARLATGSSSSSSSNSNGSSSGRTSGAAPADGSQSNYNYNNYHYFHYNHHQPYGDYEESFELHERVGKESMLLRADTPLKTRYWLQMLRYHAKDLGQWRSRRNGLPNIMMMRHE